MPYLLYLVLVICISFQAQVQAQEHDDPDTSLLETQEEEDTNVMAWLSDTRNAWSHTIGNTGQRLDGFFADSEVIEKTNNSFVKLALKARYGKYGETELEPLAKFRLDLPTLKERLRFTIESEASETQTLEEKNRENTADNEAAKTVEDSTIASFKLQFEEIKNKFNAERWNASTSIGAELEFPINTFWRNRLSYTLPINELWTFNTQQKLYYFHQDGWGESTHFMFQRLGDEYVFRSNTDAKYIHKEHIMEFAKRFTLLTELSPKRAISYQLGILGTNTPNPRVTSYFINSVYRRKLYDEWLFYEMTPELVFPREEHFKATPSLTIKLEIVFSSNQ